jgi:hypothetical protein
VILLRLNRVWRRRLGPERDEVTGVGRKFHNEELHDLYSSPNSVRVIKSRRMRWAGHVVRLGEGRGVYRVLVGKPMERDHWGDPGVDERIILSGSSRSRMWGMDCIELAQDRHRWQTLGNEASGSIKCRKFLD